MTARQTDIEIVQSDGVLYAARVQNKIVRDLSAQRVGDTLVEGAVLLGRLSKRLSGGQGAWVDIGQGQSAPLAAPGDAREGALVPVQLLGSRRAARGGKLPSLTLDIALPGRFLVYRPFGAGLSYSRRLLKAQRQSWPEALSGWSEGGWLVRSAVADAPIETVLAEAAHLVTQAEKLSANQPNARLGDVLLDGPTVWQRAVMDETGPVAVRCADPVLKPQITAWLATATPDLPPLVGSVQTLMALIDDIGTLLAPGIPLEGGGTLWIEQTRALTAVDIDAPMGANPAVINKLAAQALARHIRLRNLGGLFAVDFLRMGNAGDKKNTLTSLQTALSQSVAQHQFSPDMSPIGPYLFSRERRGTPIADAIDGTED